MKLTLNKLTRLAFVAGFALTASHIALADQIFSAGVLGSTQYYQSVDYQGDQLGNQAPMFTDTFNFGISSSMPNLSLSVTNQSSSNTSPTDSASGSQGDGLALLIATKDISLYSVSLVKVGVSGPLFSWTQTGAAPTFSAGNLSQTVHSLIAGNYELLITGTPSGVSNTVDPDLGLFTGFNGGTYSVAMNAVAVTPVPEPESYALMLAGLGLVAFAARRNNVG